MTKINRESLLHTLESAQPGLSPKEIIEQSNCFVFQNGKIYTYNDETSCSIKAPFDKEFTAAIPAQKFLEILKRLPDEELETSVKDGHLVFAGKNKDLGVRMDVEIALPLDNVEKPLKESWSKLPDDFGEAVQIVSQCCGHDESQFNLTCVHIHPKWLEACDQYQICRWAMKTGIKEPTLVRYSAIKHLTGLGMNEFAETNGWIHFRNVHGLMLSCRRYLEDYPDLEHVLQVEGVPATLPKGLADAADSANIFSSEDSENNTVKITLKSGRIDIKGVGISGYYSERKKIRYDGEPIEFRISPQLLTDLVKRHTEVSIAPGKLKVDGGSYQYVSCLGVVEGKEEAEPEEESSTPPKKTNPFDGAKDRTKKVFSNGNENGTTKKIGKTIVKDID